MSGPVDFDSHDLAARVERLITMLPKDGPLQQDLPEDDFRRRHGIEAVRRIVSHHPEFRDVLWQTFIRCYAINPAAIRRTVTLLAFYLHLGPYAHHAAEEARKTASDLRDAGEPRRIAAG